MRKLIGISLAGLCCAAAAAAQTGSEVTLHDMTGPDCVRQVFAITEQSALKLPQWFPDRDLPPLSIAKAASPAREWAGKRYPKFDSVDVSAIDIQKVGWGRIPHRWFYLFRLEPVVDGHRFFGSEIAIAILMDGTVVPPRTEKVQTIGMPCSE